MADAAIRRPPTRSCVACRTPRAKRELMRIVRTTDGRVLLDPSGRVNGRGAYVCPTGTCLADAIARGTLSRALETPVPASLLQESDALTTQTHDRSGGPRGQE